MAKMTVDEFRRGMSDDSHAADRIRRRERVRQARVRAECSGWGAAVLLQVARVSCILDGLPERIALGSPRGHCRGLEAVLANGKWMIGGTDQAVLDTWQDTPDVRAEFTNRSILAAVGIPPTPEAIRRLGHACAWDNPALDATALLREAFGRLHDHTVRAAAANNLLVRLASGWQAPESTWQRTAWEAADLFPLPPPEALDGILDVLSTAAVSGDAEAIETMLRMEPPPGRRRPDVDEEGTAALLACVAAGIERIETARTLLACGVSPDCRDGTTGGTALHVLATCAKRDNESGEVELAAALVDGGVDPDALDGQDMTALDVLRKHPGVDGSDPDNDHLLDYLMGSASPSPR